MVTSFSKLKPKNYLAITKVISPGIDSILPPVTVVFVQGREYENFLSVTSIIVISKLPALIFFALVSVKLQEPEDGQMGSPPGDVNVPSLKVNFRFL